MSIAGGELPSTFTSLLVTSVAVTATSTALGALAGTLFRFHALPANTVNVRYRQGTTGDYAELAPGEARFIYLNSIATVEVIASSASTLIVERYQ